MAESDDFDFKLYRYSPSLPAAIVFVVAFLGLSLAHVWRINRHRSFYFTPFTIGGFFEVAGYAGRISSHSDPEALGGFIVQAVLVLVAPALFAASIYMILGRLIRSLHAERLSIIPVRWLTTVFVTSDVLSFLLQAGGGGLQGGGTLELFDKGEKLITGGLILQIVVFAFFMATTLLFHYRLSRNDTPVKATSIPWKRHLTVLYVSSVLILVRSIFRVIEYQQGNSGYLISHEVFLYIFDALLMAAVMAVFFIFYVDDLDSAGVGKQEANREALSSDGSQNGQEMSAGGDVV